MFKIIVDGVLEEVVNYLDDFDAYDYAVMNYDGVIELERL